MIRRRSPAADLADQMGARFSRAESPPPPASEAAVERVVSTGSTLLDLAISGGRFDGGGIPGGILVEIFGPSGCGKTVLLCEIAGAVQRLGGEVLFRDPEARLNAQFAQIFGFEVERVDYGRPSTVTELFGPLLKWEPETPVGAVSGIFADSLAALSTDLEMGKDGDKYGMRRAKEFSEQCRKFCRVLAERNLLMVCSNQIRQNPDAGMFAEKFVTPGGNAIPFYSSLRLRCHSPVKIKRERKVNGRDVSRVVGVETTVDVYKSSIWEPHRSAAVSIVYDYGIDDIRANLEFLKTSLGLSSYNVLGDGVRLGQGIERAIREIEDGDLQKALRARTIEVWRDVDAKFRVERRPKVRI